MLTFNTLMKTFAQMRGYGEGQHFFDDRRNPRPPMSVEPKRPVSTAPGWYRDWDDEACAFVQKEKQGPVRPEESPA